MSNCRQIGTVPVSISAALLPELHRLGLASRNDKDVLFRVLNGSHDVAVAEAYYERTSGGDLQTAEVIAVFKEVQTFHVVHEVRFQEIDADASTITTWNVLDLTDLNNSGNQHLVLEGDEYEDHWLEVLKVGDDLSTTPVFSGLGYFL